MPTTLKLKRFSLGLLFASLRPKRDSPSSSFPVQTGFPTSIADLVVKNNGRLTKPPRSSDVPVSPMVEVPNELTPPLSQARITAGSEAPSPQTRELLAGGSGGDDPTADRKWKWKRSLKKLVSKNKLDSKDSFERPDAVPGDVADKAAKKIEIFSTEQTPPEPSIGGLSSSSSRAESVVVAVEERRPVRFPLLALVMVILAGLLAGKIAAIALTVLCVALFSGAVHLLGSY